MEPSSDIFGQIKNIWARFTPARKAAVIGSIAAVAVGIFALSYWASTDDFQRLTVQSNSANAGKVIARLEEEGIDYRVLADGRTILVAAGQIDDANRAMAQGGLSTATSGDDDEGGGIFSKSSPLNREHRKELAAREAEKRLAHAIERFEFVDVAKVTITPGRDHYSRIGRHTAKASVQVATRDIPSDWQIQSITHVVTSGVENLSAQDITIQDMMGTILKYPDEGESGAQRTNFAHQKKLESERARKAQEALDFVYGSQKTHVTVSADIDWTRSTTTKLEYDPNSGVTRQRTKSEDSKVTSRKEAGGPVGARAPDNGSGGTTLTDTTSSTTESKEFDKSETELVKMGGEIKRLSAAVFIDETLAEQRAEIEKTIIAAIGLDVATRGDTIALHIAPIHGRPDVAVDEPSSALTLFDEWGQTLEWGLYALLGFAFLFFALRTIKKAQNSLRDVLEKSLEEDEVVETVAAPLPLEQTVLQAVQNNSDLAGRSLKRWLYEPAHD